MTDSGDGRSDVDLLVAVGDRDRGAFTVLYNSCRVTPEPPDSSVSSSPSPLRSSSVHPQIPRDG